MSEWVLFVGNEKSAFRCWQNGDVLTPALLVLIWTRTRVSAVCIWFVFLYWMNCTSLFSSSSLRWISIHRHLVGYLTTLFFFNQLNICLLVLNNFTRTTFFSSCWVFNMHKLAAQGLRLFVSFQRLDTEPTTLRLRGEERKLNVNLGSNLHIFQSASEALTPQPFVSGRLVCVQLWALWSVSCLWYELTCSITEEGVWLLHLELFVFSCLCGFHSVYL